MTKLTTVKRDGITFSVGDRIRVSNGLPRPPERFNRKLRDWKDANYTGEIVEIDHWDDVDKTFITSKRDDYPDDKYAGIMTFRFTRPLDSNVTLEELEENWNLVRDLP